VYTRNRLAALKLRQAMQHECVVFWVYQKPSGGIEAPPSDA